jgi:hypothetical protein
MVMSKLKDGQVHFRFIVERIFMYDLFFQIMFISRTQFSWSGHLRKLTYISDLRCVFLNVGPALKIARYIHVQFIILRETDWHTESIQFIILSYKIDKFIDTESDLITWDLKLKIFQRRKRILCNATKSLRYIDSCLFTYVYHLM